MLRELHDRVLHPDTAALDQLVDQALRQVAPEALVRDTVLPAMREVIAQHQANQIILPDLLRSAEVTHRVLSQADPEQRSSFGSIVVATLPGDVHDIGRCLLVTVLAACGFTVHDLGSQVPIDRIIQAATDQHADAIGLSALLVTTSRQMPLCIQALDARDIHLPVLVGGAAINRAFGRRSAILSDGRIYEPGVFYCRDVFEGVSTLDALLRAAPDERAAFVHSVRTEIQAERDHLSEPPVERVPATSSQPSLRSVAVPTPPYLGARRVSLDLREVWRYLDRNTLFRYHWGGYRASAEDLVRIVADEFEPELARLQNDALRKDWLEARLLIGYFPCNADGNQLVVFDPDTPDREIARLTFPRQPDGERLCLADYFRPLDSGERDLLPLQAVSAGPHAGAEVQHLQREGQFRRMLLVNGLASATAEALAETAHQHIRAELGLAADRGLRFSWGYPACPDLEQQRVVLPLLHAEQEIGLTLTQSANLNPEHSTAALVVHHPQAKYFAVRASSETAP